MKRTCFALALSLLAACASSKITAFRDPAYATKRFASVVVFAQGMALDAALKMETDICAKLAPTPCVTGKSVLPPTREYQPNEAAEYLSRSGAEAVLVLALVSDQSDSRYFGTIVNSTGTASTTSSGNVNFFGNSALWSGTSYTSTSAQTTAIPLYAFSRIALGQLGLFERRTGEIAWRGEIKVTGQGALNISDGAFINSATSKVAEELKTSGLVN